MNAIDVPWHEFYRLDLDPRTHVAPNFQLYELYRSEIATRHGINNVIRPVAALRCAVYYARIILQPVRDYFGPYTPNSVFRCQDVERVLKGKARTWQSSSQHVLGQAGDIEIPGLANYLLAQWIADYLKFDQLILECFNPALGPNSGWVHVSIVPPGMGVNRKQILSYLFDAEKAQYIYKSGIVIKD